jgi:hypothetical protein
LVSSTFRTVCVREAHCSSQPDKEKILAIIESSFTSLTAFDRHVGLLLTDVIDGTHLT